MLNIEVKFSQQSYDLPMIKSTINKGNNKITELRTILQRESQIS